MLALLPILFYFQVLVIVNHFISCGIVANIDPISFLTIIIMAILFIRSVLTKFDFICRGSYKPLFNFYTVAAESKETMEVGK